MSADTLLSNFYTRAKLRLDKGESNILEKATAENYKDNFKIRVALNPATNSVNSNCFRHTFFTTNIFYYSILYGIIIA